MSSIVIIIIMPGWASPGNQYWCSQKWMVSHGTKVIVGEHYQFSFLQWCVRIIITSDGRWFSVSIDSIQLCVVHHLHCIVKLVNFTVNTCEQISIEFSLNGPKDCMDSDQQHLPNLHHWLCGNWPREPVPHNHCWLQHNITHSSISASPILYPHPQPTVTRDLSVGPQAFFLWTQVM